MKILPKLAAVIAASFLAVSLLATASQSNVGKTIPDLKLEYVKNAVQPAGKPMILEFWATWCPPCRKSIPHLNEIYKKYQDRGLLAVGVTDEDRPTVDAFLAKMKMDYTVAIDAEGALGNSFGIKGIPHAMLVDKTGKIVWEGHPLDLQDSDIEQVLK
ncbi:MAG: TlpA disulfide reductase family protein [Opitutaceae bacterium]|jgi:thiol-disulfide isomerase/thioredoxin